MMHPNVVLILGPVCAVVLAGTPPAAAQGLGSRHRPLAANVIVPQTGTFALRHADAVRMAGVDVAVEIRGQAATTTIDLYLQNPTTRRLEAELILPVPEGTVVRGFAFAGSAAEPTARLLPKDEARDIYDGLVAQTRDPALLEFLGYNLIRSSVFPVEGQGTQQVRLIYEHLLPAVGNRVDYSLPRSESLDYTVPWTVDLRIQSPRGIATVYSPSHRLETRRLPGGAVAASLAPGGDLDPGPFLLSYLFAGGGVSASLFAYPDLSGSGGYFLLLASPDAAPASHESLAAIQREVILVLDCSGSMRGAKLDQVREAALQTIAALEEGETFNVIVYNGNVDLFATAPVAKNHTHLEQVRTYLAGVTASGGTNIHQALLTALQQRCTPGALPIVLFLTDGLPTIGEISERQIRALAVEHNPQRRRVFTFGVGVDVNAPLLDAIATTTRARSCYVLPGEDVETKVAQQVRQLTGPLLADPVLNLLGDGTERSRVRDMIPAEPPDLFAGDQLVLLGRYTGSEPLEFQLKGNLRGRTRTFRYRFDLDHATPRNAFVPRLWASRKIATLVDAVRQMGAGEGSRPLDLALAPSTRFGELVDEIVRLSTEFGILTEYTAFLAEDGSDLSDRGLVFNRTARHLQDRAVATRSGKGAVGQSLNTKAQISQKARNYKNRLAVLDDPALPKNMPRERNIQPSETGRTDKQPGPGVADLTFNSVRQVNDRAFFWRQGQWIDSRFLDGSEPGRPTRTLAFGSQEFSRLVHDLARSGRQGIVALRGDILVEIDGQAVLIVADADWQTQPQ